MKYALLTRITARFPASVSFWGGTLMVVGLVGVLCYYSAIHWFQKNSTRFFPTTTPQWFATGIAITKMGDDGTPYQQLFAGEMRHFALAHTTELKNIHVNVFSETDAPWELTAKQGQAFHASDKLENIASLDLIDHVVLKKESPKEGVSAMNTEFLRLFPDTRKAETDRRVDFAQPGHHISAIGMDADFNTNKIILRKQVKSEHEPNQTPRL